MFYIANKTESLIESIVRPLVEELGYEYVGVEINPSGGAKELIIYADKPDGIGLDDCEKISRLIEPAIDENDPIKDSYFLCVSSPGLDRPLKEPADYKRNTGKKIDVKLYSAKEGRKEFTGLLRGYDDTGFTIEIGGSEKRFTYREAASVRLHVDITGGNE